MAAPPTAPMAPPPQTLSPHGLPVVLDTNVVLDWLVFRDPAGLPLDAAIRAGQLLWCATDAMRLELEHVLTREHIASWLTPESTPMVTWSDLSRPHDSAPPARLHCRDPDDQKFIDLAMHLGNALLLSRDRAVLALARRAGEAGVEVMTLADWSARQRPAAAA